MGKIEIVHGDITKSTSDVIVNAAKPSLTGGSGVDGAIHTAAGPSVLNECLDIPIINGVRCATGEVRITGSGDLSSKYIIHTVGPIYLEDLEPEKNLIKSYSNAIELALKKGCQSIAFPAISCGKYGYPAEEAAEIAVETCKKYIDENIDIYLYSIDDDVFSSLSKSYKILINRS